MWSAVLQQKMMLLTSAQRRAIVVIVSGEAGGISLTRLLRTPYSCPHCGLVVGRSGQAGAERKKALAAHVVECVHKDQKWQFAAIYSTFYAQWRHSLHFCECLSEARAEVVSMALDEASRILQIGTPEAAREAMRQIAEGKQDKDKLTAAFGVLDRASRGTAPKIDDSMARWLEELRKDEMADPGAEGHDLSPDKAPAEPDAGADPQ